MGEEQIPLGECRPLHEDLPYEGICMTRPENGVLPSMARFIINELGQGLYYMLLMALTSLCLQPRVSLFQQRS